MHIRDFQRKIEALYFEKDSGRGLERTFMWFVEEVGELSRELLHRADSSPPPSSNEPLSREFADVLAWLATLASIVGVDLESAAAAKYGAGCPKCEQTPCGCRERPGSGGNS
ncbi:MazG nucleotide pyrophosphohydrolase domain-containing protein [Planctomycetota bacterium]